MRPIRGTTVLLEFRPQGTAWQQKSARTSSPPADPCGGACSPVARNYRPRVSRSPRHDRGDRGGRIDHSTSTSRRGRLDRAGPDRPAGQRRGRRRPHLRGRSLPRRSSTLHVCWRGMGHLVLPDRRQLAASSHRRAPGRVPPRRVAAARVTRRPHRRAVYRSGASRRPRPTCAAAASRQRSMLARRGAAAIVTLAPELPARWMPIRHCSGVLVSLGHSGADASAAAPRSRLAPRWARICSTPCRRSTIAPRPGRRAARKPGDTRPDHRRRAPRSADARSGGWTAGAGRVALVSDALAPAGAPPGERAGRAGCHFRRPRGATQGRHAGWQRDCSTAACARRARGCRG